MSSITIPLNFTESDLQDRVLRTPTPYTATLFVAAGIIGARDNKNGLIDLGNAGVDDSRVIQNAVNKVVANSGRLLVKNGNYLPATQILINGTNSHWEIEWEKGAKWTYTGTGFCLSIRAATRGSIQLFRLKNPYIVSSTGNGLQIIGGYQFAIENPRLQISTTGASVGLDIDALNTARIYGGDSYISGPGNGNVGSIGIRLANTGATHDVDIDISQISLWEDGTRHGIAAGTNDMEGISIRSYWSVNKNALHILNANGLKIRGYFESQVSNTVFIDNIGNGICGGISIEKATFFSEGVGVNNVNIANYCSGFYMDDGILHGSGNYVFGTNLTKGRASLYGVVGTVTLNTTSTDFKVVSDQAGKYTQNSGKSIQSGNGATTVFNIPHNLITVPNYIQLTPATPAAQAAYTLTSDATNIIITFSVAPPNAANNLVWHWEAKVSRQI
jgi:hypothetical protein